MPSGGRRVRERLASASPDGAKFVTADVFTNRIFGGNPLAVFPDAGAMTDELMQRIAREMNLSETVFIVPPKSSAHFRGLRIFTPLTELPFAGHPTIGAALVLHALGVVPRGNSDEEVRITLGADAGPIPVTIRTDVSGACVAQLTAPRLPERGPNPPQPEALATLLSLPREQLFEGDGAASAWSGGVPFLFVRLHDHSALAAARLNSAVWSEVLERWWAPQVVPFVVEDEASLRMRMFSPAFGIAEDPATGSAAVAIAGYLTAAGAAADGTRRWTIAQGVEMGRPSTLHLEADLRDGALRAVRLAGEAVIVSEGVMHVRGTAPAFGAGA